MTRSSPVLLRQNRLALVALTPRSAYVVAAARDVPFPLLLLVAVARLGVADPVHFVLGREAGPAVLARAQRTRLLGRFAGRLPSTPSNLWLSAVAISPTAKTMVVAGGLGLPAGRVAVANVAGTVARVLIVWTAGQAFPSAGEALAVAVRLGGGAVCGGRRRPDRPPAPAAPAHRAGPPAERALAPPRPGASRDGVTGGARAPRRASRSALPATGSASLR